MDAAITAATASADAEDDGAKIPPELEGVPIEKSDEIEEELAEDALQAETLADAPVPAPSTLDALISMSGGATADPQALITDQAAQLENAIKAQKESRPLAKMQEEQDKLDEAMAAAEGEAASGSDTPSELGEHPKKHSVLHDNDVELYHLTQHLTDVHKRFYETLDSARGITNGTPQSTQPVVPAKKNPRKRSTHGEDGGKVDLRLVPDVAQIMSRTKRQTFKDCVIVFSGIIPLNANVQLSDPAIWAKSFGATVVEHIDSRVTHVVAARNRTTKVRLAARYEHIKIVTIQWLHDSLSQWQRMPEENYLMKVDPNDLLHPKSSSLNGMDDFNGMNPVLSSDDDSDDSEMDEEDDFDEDEFLEGETGAVGEGSNHLRIGEIDWADVDDEVNEFFGDMSDDSDEDDGKIDVAGSVKSSRSERIEVRKKRTHAEADGLGDKDGGGGADSEADGGKKKGRSRESSVESVPAEGGSRLAKRQKIARERAEEGSALKVVKDAPETPVEGEGSKESESESDRKKREEEEERSLEEALENELLGLDDDEDETGGAGGGEGGERDDGKA